MSESPHSTTGALSSAPTPAPEPGDIVRLRWADGLVEDGRVAAVVAGSVWVRRVLANPLREVSEPYPLPADTEVLGVLKRGASL